LLSYEVSPTAYVCSGIVKENLAQGDKAVETLNLVDDCNDTGSPIIDPLDLLVINGDLAKSESNKKDMGLNVNESALDHWLAAGELSNRFKAKPSALRLSDLVNKAAVAARAAAALFRRRISAVNNIEAIPIRPPDE
jgi:hypothetical protein